MSKVNPISIESLDLICDADGCGHVERGVRVAPELIGKPCPKCGASLLTEEDYAAALASFATIDLLNASIGPVESSGEAIRHPINPRHGIMAGVVQTLNDIEAAIEPEAP